MPDLERKLAQRRQARRRSQLVSVGGVLVALAFLVPRPLHAAAAEMAPGVLRSAASIATDVFRAGFFVGIGCAVIGALRNRRWRREAEAMKADLPQP
jgi:hypothetical protein